MKCQVKGCKQESRWVSKDGDRVCDDHFNVIEVLTHKDNVPVYLLPLLGEAESLTLVYEF